MGIVLLLIEVLETHLANKYNDPHPLLVQSLWLIIHAR
jgi:hypothetical protein